MTPVEQVVHDASVLGELLESTPELQPVDGGRIRQRVLESRVVVLARQHLQHQRPGPFVRADRDQEVGDSADLVLPRALLRRERSVGVERCVREGGADQAALVVAQPASDELGQALRLHGDLDQ